MLDEAMDRRILYKADFETSNAESRKEIWKQHLPAELPVAEDVDLEELARKFTFSGGYIKNAVILACHRLASGMIPDFKIHQKDLVDAAKTQRKSQLERLTERVIPSSRLEDVVLNPEQKHAVEAIIAEYRNRDTVFSQWGFGDVTPYGRGTIAILYGPSGSGKTLTANAIASELGLNLMNVSANHVVSSYVGESAKRIHDLFAQAKDEEDVILFDECESLFASRCTENGSNAAVNRDNNQDSIELKEKDMTTNGWTQHVHPDQAQIESMRRFASAGSYAFLVIFERDAEFDEEHGSARFAVVFLGGDGIATYDAIFCNKNAQAPFCVVLQDHGYGGNWNRFGKGGLMEKAAQNANVYPKYILATTEDSTELWEGYVKVPDAPAVLGGMYRVRRELFERF